MELSPEDSLRIQVLLQNDLQAIRLDESFMILYGKTSDGEASIPLSPNCNNDQYLSIVKSELSEHTLGTTGGYPLYLKRWNRMGQTDTSFLNNLLLLGENEAVVSVANAPNIPYEVAKLTWWCATNTEQQPYIAKYLLARKSVIDTTLSLTLTNYLFEYIPFINDHSVLLNAVILLLKTGKLSKIQQDKLWGRATSKIIYLIAFIVADPNNLPPSDFVKAIKNNYPSEQKQSDEAIIKVIKKTETLAGQNFLFYVKKALNKLPEEVSTYLLLNAIGHYFKSALLTKPQRNYQKFSNEIDKIFKENEPYLSNKSKAVCKLSGVNETIVFDSILHSGAVGSQLRKRIKSVTDIILDNLKDL